MPLEFRCAAGERSGTGGVTTGQLNLANLQHQRCGQWCGPDLALTVGSFQFERLVGRFQYCEPAAHFFLHRIAALFEKTPAFPGGVREGALEKKHLPNLSGTGFDTAPLPDRISRLHCSIPPLLIGSFRALLTAPAHHPVDCVRHDGTLPPTGGRHLPAWPTPPESGASTEYPPNPRFCNRHLIFFPHVNQTVAATRPVASRKLRRGDLKIGHNVGHKLAIR